jgi:aminoglycoside 6'-N-acetyltransferase I
MNAVIRLAKPEDRIGWERLRSQLWPECPLERHRLEIEQLLAGSGVVALASTEEELVGFVEVSARVDHVEGTTSVPVAYLEGWYVAEKFRGRGIGRALLAFAEKWATEHGYRELASDAEIANASSIRLHKIAGFREVGRSVHFVKSLTQVERQNPTTDEH